MMSPEIRRRNALVEAWLWLAETIAKNVMQSLPPCFDYEDLRQAGYVGLLDAATRFDESRGVPFRSYAALRIRGEIIESVRRRRWRDNTALPITAETLERPDASAGVETIHDQIEREQQKALIDEALGGLTEAERKALEIYYVQDGKLAGVGRAFGVRVSRSSQVLTLARKSLMRELEWRGVAVDIETGCTEHEMSDEYWNKYYERRNAKRAKAQTA